MEPLNLVKIESGKYRVEASGMKFVIRKLRCDGARRGHWAWFITPDGVNEAVREFLVRHWPNANGPVAGPYPSRKAALDTLVSELTPKPRYSIDAADDELGPDPDEVWTLDQILRANEPETFDSEDLDRIRALNVGEKISFGGGAWAEFTIKRES